MQELRVVTNADRRDLGEQLAAVFRPVWPEFIFHDSVDAEYVSRVERYFERYDVLLLDDQDQILTGGWGVPIRWDGAAAELPEGYDDAMVRAVTGQAPRG